MHSTNYQITMELDGSIIIWPKDATIERGASGWHSETHEYLVRISPEEAENLVEVPVEFDIGG